MSYTAADQINRALRLLGVLAEGETPSAETSADALMALNQMIDSWSTERLTVFSVQEQIVTWPSGQSSRTFGPTGDLTGTRPVSVDDETHFRDSSGLVIPVQVVSDAWDLSTSASGNPRLLRVNMEFPDIELAVYPVPSQDLSLHVISVNPLTQPAALSTVLSFPPGYLRAFTYNLALEIAPEFGVEPPAVVVQVAMTSKRDIRRLNHPDRVMEMPVGLVGRYHFDINEG